MSQFNTAPSSIQSASGAFPITPDDANDIMMPTRGVYIGAAGNLRVLMVDGTEVTFTSLAVGVVHPLQVRRVYSTSTTAGLIVGLY